MGKIIDPINIRTLALVISTVFLWRSTDRLARLAEEQGMVTNDLFLKDQRPWLNVRADVMGIVYNIQEISITINIHFFVKKIGKTPVMEAGNGIWPLVIGYEGFQEIFDGLRRFTEARNFSKGRTIFPGEEDSWDLDWR